MCVTANVGEDDVHAEEALTRADLRNIVVGQSVEERDTAAGLENFVVGGSKKAIGEPIPTK